MINMDRKNIFVIAVILFSAAVGATPMLIQEKAVETVKSDFDASVTVLNESSQEGYGINADRVLKFGRLYTGANATKYLNVTANKRAFMELEVEGNISDLIVEPEDEKWVEGRTVIPVEVQGRDPGYYSGKVLLTFYVPKNSVGEKWVNLTRQ